MEPLHKLIKKRTRRQGLAKTLTIYELFSEWNRHAARIFGNKKINCRPRVFKGKTLIVEVDGASLASELQLRQHQLVERINQHFGRRLVERIVFKL
ncbi:MAG: DUF721 domain-containing protein [Candidatus Doudnabacteria bacterium]|nr:DUF721 domain-containing protein [Candidatus Doudnabacteria bacterium]